MNAETKQVPALFAMSDLEKMATSMVKSKLFGIATTEQAVTLMLLAQSEGLHPATAARDFHIIQGRPSMKADTMLARFQASGGIVEWQDYTDSKVSATFKHPSSPKPVLIEWTMEMAKKIGLTGKDNWRNYPRAMLRARVVSEGVRTCYPVIAAGIYTPEEVQDFAQEKDITPSAGFFQALPAKRQEIVSETAAQIREYMENDRAFDAYALIETGGFDAEEQISLWSLLPSDQRSALKRIQADARAHESGKISPAQKKRLEARIGELGLDRERVKRHCADTYSVSTFGDLMQDQYKELDEALETLTDSAPRASTPAQAFSPATDGGGADLITADEAVALEAACNESGISAAALKKAAGVERFAQIKAADLQRAKDWIARAVAKRQEASA